MYWPKVVLGCLVIGSMLEVANNPEAYKIPDRSPLRPGIQDTQPPDCTKPGWELRHLQECYLHKQSSKK